MMLYKYVSETEIEECPDNGRVTTVDRFGFESQSTVFGLPAYYARHPAVALENGYKPLVGDAEPPEETGYHAVYTDGETEITRTWVEDGGEE